MGMDLSILFKRAGEKVADNSPAILTAIGVTGTLATAYLAAKAAFKAADVLREKQSDKDSELLADNQPTEPLSTKEQFEATWKLYTPAAASAAMTVAAIVCAVRISDRRTAAVATAYSVLDKSYGEYRAKTLAKTSKPKEQAIRDEIAQDKITKNPPSSTEVIIVSGGTVLCHDGYSGRYFYSDMETLRRAENDINWQILNEDHASLTDFWDKIGIKRTSESDELGWNTDRQFTLEITTALSEDNKPCIVYEFRYPPMPLFYRNSR